MTVNTSTRSICNPIENLLRFYDMWPEARNLSGRVYALSHLGFYVIQFWAIIENIHSAKLTDSVEYINTALTELTVMIKLISFWCCSRYVHSLLQDLANDWRFEKSVQGNEIMCNHAKKARFLCNSLMITIYVSGVLFILRSVFIYCVKSGEDRKLIVEMTGPFSTKQSPYFELMLLVQFSGIIQTCTTEVLGDGCLFSFVMHAVGQIEILNHEITSILKTAKPEKVSKEILVKIVNKHQRIIQFCLKTEIVFRIPCLVQTTVTSIGGCLLGFLLITCWNDMDVLFIMKTACVLMTQLCVLFMYCAIGQYILDKSATIRETLYDGNWYGFSPRHMKLYIFVLLRSRKTHKLTVAKFATVSFEHFASIMATSLSYLSVLRAVS